MRAHVALSPLLRVAKPSFSNERNAMSCARTDVATNINANRKRISA